MSQKITEDQTHYAIRLTRDDGVVTWLNRTNDAGWRAITQRWNYFWSCNPHKFKAFGAAKRRWRCTEVQLKLKNPSVRVEIVKVHTKTVVTTKKLFPVEVISMLGQLA